MLENFKRTKKRVLFIVFLLIANAFITFSGFVAYTSEERRACDLIKHIYSMDSAEEREEEHRSLGEDNKKLVSKYLQSYRKQGFCISIEKFIINEFAIIFFGIILILIRKKNKN